MATRYVEVTMEVDEEIDNVRLKETLEKGLLRYEEDSVALLVAHILDIVDVEDSEQR